MFELQQSAVGTPDEFKRPAGDRLIGSAWEHPRKALFPKVENGDEMRAAADPAAFDFPHGAPSCIHPQILSWVFIGPERKGPWQHQRYRNAFSTSSQHRTGSPSCRGNAHWHRGKAMSR